MCVSHFSPTSMVLGLTFSATSTAGNYFQWITNNNIAQTGSPKCYAYTLTHRSDSIQGTNYMPMTF